ncbi:TraU family protein [Thalassolituus marinus]|uniref:TraU family protein n=2 Tax=Thalassolituus marinus TaxID=671053 RepID=A0ABS7ZYE2_9GAMM|nr:TraU family protein [Thalassolituus marinus]
MRKIIIFCAMIFLSPLSKAESCPDAGIFGSKLLKAFCWDCLFPMRINGQTLRADSGASGPIPDGAMNQLICSCPDAAGVPEFGQPLSAWFPRFITETIQKPYCSPSLAGTTLANGTRVAVGGDVSSRKLKAGQMVSDAAFLHFHTLSFPILEMLELVMESSCNPDKFVDMELQYISEPDPLWNDNLLSAMLTPESVLFTNPAAMAVCSYECNAVTADPNSLDYHWCAGCWGGVYPFTGHANHNGSRVKHSSLVMTKALAALHRRLLAFNTVGPDAACETKIAPSLIKKQYRFGMMYPSPEAKSVHAIGESTLVWGESRQKAAAGSNHVYIGFRYQDCCVR